MDRQRILMIFAGAWVSAALLSWFVYAKITGPKQEKLTRVVAAARDLPAGTRLRKNDMKFVQVAEKDLPKAAVFDDKLALDRALLYPVNANETLVTNKLSNLTGAEGVAATIEPGKRAVSVPVTDVSSAGGLILPRSKVDVLFTRTGSVREALTTTLLEDVVVLSIGKLTEAGQQLDPRQQRPQTQAATLMVTPEEAQRLEWAKNQGRIGLVLRNPLDRSRADKPAPVTAEVIDPMLYTGPRPVRGPGAPGVRNDKYWNELINAEAPKPKPVVEKKEPPKPRHVIDVYRGDKHVQEIFQ